MVEQIILLFGRYHNDKYKYNKYSKNTKIIFFCDSRINIKDKCFSNNINIKVINK